MQLAVAVLDIPGGNLPAVSVSEWNNTESDRGWNCMDIEALWMRVDNEHESECESEFEIEFEREWGLEAVSMACYSPTVALSEYYGLHVDRE